MSANLVAGARGRRVYEPGDPEAGIWTVGMAQALLHDTPTAVELITRTVMEAHETLTAASSRFTTLQASVQA
jgi:NADH:quinone reductase (non-electrogenic)